MGKAIETNHLSAGMLGRVDQRNPDLPRYKEGAEEISGAEVRGGRVVSAPALGGLAPYLFRNQFVPYPDGHFYNRNTAAAGDAESQATFTASDIGPTSPVNLADLLEGILVAGNHCAAQGGGDKVGAFDRYAAPASTPQAKVWSTANTTPINVEREIRFVRAFPYYNSGTGKTQWGVVCKKHASWDYEKKILLMHTDGGNGGDDSLVFGTGKVSDSDWTEIYSDLGTVWQQTGVTVSVEPVVFTAKKGFFQAVDVDVYVVGKMKMFNGAPALHSYSLAHSITGGGNTVTATADTAGKTPNQSGLEDVYVLFWGTPATVDGSDGAVSGKDVAFVPVQMTSALSTAQFKFTTTRNLVVGLRRFGCALVVNPGQNVELSERNKYLGATQLAAAAGDGNASVFGAGATNKVYPYALRLDSQPVWYEATYQGILVGTANAEYILTNHQDATAVTVARVSSVGSRAAIDFRRAASTQLLGHVYFVSRRGVATVKFSNESQSYLPDELDLSAMGFGTPISIASSRVTGMVYVHTQALDTSTQYIVALNPLTGAPSVRTISSLTEAGVTYGFWGLDTVDGEPLLVWYNQASGPVDSSTWKESRLSGSTRTSTMIRTSRFFPNLEKRARIVYVLLNLVATTGGRVRIATSRGEAWTPLPLTSDQVAYGFTGTLKVPVTDIQENEAGGKAVELQFYEHEKFELVSVSVEAEVV